jgi:hypothetical protein
VRSEATVLVIMSFLIVTLIYGSVAQSELFGLRPKPTSSYTCYKSTATEPGAVSAQTCCHVDYDKNGNQVGSTVCTKCQYDTNGDLTSNCTTFYPKTGQTGGVTPPASATTNAFPTAGSNNTGPVNSTTTKALPGLFKPAGNADNAVPPTPPPTLLAKQPSSGHHHHKGGSISSSNTNSTGH